ncbi:phage portal protein [Azospirillum sp. sgz302134]
MWPFRRKQTRSAGEWDTWRTIPFFGYGQTAAGVPVTAENPITHHTVFSCINVIAEGVAMLPLNLYRERGPSRRLATDHPLYELLLTSPCPHMTAFGYWKLAFFEKLHYGNHYSLKVFDDAGRLAELVPIQNGRVQPFWYQDPIDGMQRRAYRVSAPTGTQATFLEDEIFHIANLPILCGPNYGLMGASVWQHYQAETMGGALATNQFAAKSFANGAGLSGMISVEASLQSDQARELRDLVREAYAGADNAGKIGVFGNDAKFTPMSVDAQRSQLLESRKFDRSVIAGILRVTAHLINDLERGTFSNVEHLDLSHYKHCLLPHLTDLCQTASKDLLTPEERRTLYVEPDPTVLLMGDQATLGEVLEKAVNNGRMTPNEARAIENRPPKEGGDELFINGAAVPLRLAAQGKAGKPAADAPVQENTDANTDA